MDKQPHSSADSIGTVIAWLVILACTAYVAVRVHQSSVERDRRIVDARSGSGDAPDYPQFQMLAKYAIGVQQIFPEVVPATRPATAPAASPLLAQLRGEAVSRSDRLRMVPLIAELEGKAAAIAELDRLATLPATTASTHPATMPATAPAADRPVATALRRLYNGGRASLSAEDRGWIDRLDWVGRLALSHGAPREDPERAAVIGEAQTLALAIIAAVVAALFSGLVGFVLLVFAIVWFAQGTLRLRYSQVRSTSAPQADAGELPLPWTTYAGPTLLLPPVHAPAATVAPPVSSPGLLLGSHPAATTGIAPPKLDRPLGPIGAAQGRTAPFLEAFALSLLALVVAPGLLHRMTGNSWIAWTLGTLAIILLALAWPRLRGVPGDAWRRGFGWTAPIGLLREVGSGIVGYIAGLPVFAIGFIITIVLVKLTDASPTHPIMDEIGDGVWPTIRLYLLAAVWAPIVEETFFRGAFFHHLRRRWGWLISAVVSSVIFAAIHPQGWSMIPGLAALAIVFCAIREWRGSAVGGMVAHALHNGTLVTLMVLAAG